MIKYVNIILGVMILIMCFLSSSNQTIYAQDNLPKDKFIYGIWLSEKISRGGFKSLLEFKNNDKKHPYRWESERLSTFLNSEQG